MRAACLALYCTQIEQFHFHRIKHSVRLAHVVCVCVCERKCYLILSKKLDSIDAKRPTFYCANKIAQMNFFTAEAYRFMSWRFHVCQVLFLFFLRRFVHCFTFEMALHILSFRWQCTTNIYYPTNKSIFNEKNIMVSAASAAAVAMWIVKLYSQELHMWEFVSSRILGSSECINLDVLTA